MPSSPLLSTLYQLSNGSVSSAPEINLTTHTSTITEIRTLTSLPDVSETIVLTTTLVTTTAVHRATSLITHATPSTTSPISRANSVSSSSNTVTIVGSVIGGVVGVCLIALILWCCVRRHKRVGSDSNLDPNRHVVASPDRDPMTVYRSREGLPPSDSQGGRSTSGSLLNNSRSMQLSREIETTIGRMQDNVSVATPPRYPSQRAFQFLSSRDSLSGISGSSLSSLGRMQLPQERDNLQLRGGGIQTLKKTTVEPRGAESRKDSRRVSTDGIHGEAQVQEEGPQDYHPVVGPQMP